MIHTSWADPARTTIHLTFRRGWTLNDLRRAIMEADNMIASQPHDVHLIIDMRESGGLPRDFMSAAGDLFAAGEARDNEGQRVVIGAGALIRAAYRAVMGVYGTQLSKRPVLFAGSLEEAHQLLKPVL